jgi:mono/diheme cytochrome c family protein
MHTATPLKAICLMSIAVGSSWVSADEWQAPADAAALANPIAAAPASISSGGAVYRQSCLICHGAEGKGDGQGATYLVPKPASFADAAFRKDSDGAVSWKISTGRNAMPGFKTLLTDTQRWQVIDYLRTLAPDSAQHSGK